MRRCQFLLLAAALAALRRLHHLRRPAPATARRAWSAPPTRAPPRPARRCFGRAEAPPTPPSRPARADRRRAAKLGHRRRRLPGLSEDGGGGPITYDGRETAPAAATGNWFFKRRPAAARSTRRSPGGKSVGVPGNIRMMALAHRAHGKLPWATLFQPAIRLARDGFKVTPRLHNCPRQLSRTTGALTAAGARALLSARTASRMPVGTLVRNPALAAFLEQVAARGPDSFYVGPNAQAIVADGQRRAAQSRADDARRHRLLRRQAAAAGLRRLSRLPDLRHGPALVGRRRPCSRS